MIKTTFHVKYLEERVPFFFNLITILNTSKRVQCVICGFVLEENFGNIRALLQCPLVYNLISFLITTYQKDNLNIPIILSTIHIHTVFFLLNLELICSTLACHTLNRIIEIQIAKFLVVF